MDGKSVRDPGRGAGGAIDGGGCDGERAAGAAGGGSGAGVGGCVTDAGPVEIGTWLGGRGRDTGSGNSLAPDSSSPIGPIPAAGGAPIGSPSSSTPGTVEGRPRGAGGGGGIVAERGRAPIDAESSADAPAPASSSMLRMKSPM